MSGLVVASGVCVGRTVEIHDPRRVRIDANVDIRRNCTLDGRSDVKPSITIGAGSRIKENVWLAAYGGSVQLGKNVLVGRNNVLLGHGNIVISDYAMLGPNVVVLSSEHGCVQEAACGLPFQFQDELPLPVTIGRGSWIGAGATILGGSLIEEGVVVAAGAVVKGHLRAGWVYGGIPARELRKL